MFGRRLGALRVCGKPDAFAEVLNWILFWDGKPELINGRAHMSDMYLFQRHRPPILGPLCDDFKVGPRLPLTHVAAASVVNGSFTTPRSEIIRRLAADPSAAIS